MEQLLDQVVTIVKDLAHMMKAKTIQNIDTKGDSANLVTDVDIFSQNYLIEKLEPLIEGAVFFAEEKKDNYLTEQYTWVIDPLDGTTNFAYDYRFSAISVALVHQKTSILAVVYNLYSDEIFTAIKGKGAYLNNQAIQVSNHDFKHSLIAVGTSPYHKFEADKTFNLLKKLFTEARDLRRSGSAVLDLAYVACARVDAFYEERLAFWDYAAGSLLISEAGGVWEISRASFGDSKAITMIAGNSKNFNHLKSIIIN